LCVAYFLFIGDSKENFTDASNKTISVDSKLSPHNAKIRTEDKPEPISTIPKESYTESDALRYIQRDSWRLVGNLIDNYAELLERHNQGDLVASYILSVNLQYCWYAPSTQEGFDQALLEAQELGESDKYLQNLNRRFEFCHGIDKPKRDQFYQFLETASNGGYVPAQEALGRISAVTFMETQGYNDLPREQYIETRDQFIEDKIRYLESASSNGSMRAVARLANMYNSQNYGANGLMKAYAYNNVILEFTDNNKLYDRYTWFQQHLESKISQQEIEQALEISSKIIAKIRQNGTIYRFEDE